MSPFQKVPCRLHERIEGISVIFNSIDCFVVLPRNDDELTLIDLFKPESCYRNS